MVGWVKIPQPDPCTPLALTRENQNTNNKSAEQVKNITSLKLRPTVTEKTKMREVVSKRGKVPLYPYFHP